MCFLCWCLERDSIQGLTEMVTRASHHLDQGIPDWQATQWTPNCLVCQDSSKCLHKATSYWVAVEWRCRRLAASETGLWRVENAMPVQQQDSITTYYPYVGPAQVLGISRPDINILSSSQAIGWEDCVFAWVKWCVEHDDEPKCALVAAGIPASKEPSDLVCINGKRPDGCTLKPLRTLLQ